MQVFAEYAIRKEQPLAHTYLGCAQMVDGDCGVGYADVNTKVGSVDSGMQNGKQGGQGTNGVGRVGAHEMVMVAAGLAVIWELL